MTSQVRVSGLLEQLKEGVFHTDTSMTRREAVVVSRHLAPHNRHNGQMGRGVERVKKRWWAMGPGGFMGWGGAGPGAVRARAGGRPVRLGRGDPSCRKTGERSPTL